MHASLRLTAAVAAALLAHASVALAVPAPGPSPSDQVASDDAPASTTTAVVATSETPDVPLMLAVACRERGTTVVMSGVHYRPRYRTYRNSSRRPESAGVSQIHGGEFDPDGDQNARMDVGIRGGPMLDDNIQIGLGVDWIHKGEHISTVTTSTTGPGGVPIEVKQDIARASVNMFPIMAFMQLTASNDFGIVPYVGGGGGYQVLVLSGDDFTTGNSFEGTFSGWGWQAWAGLGIPLGGRTRLTGEAFVNGAELARDANDGPNGEKVHETVNGDGMGLRFGVAWGF